MSNQYGDNEQWCVPFSDAPSGGCVLGPNAGQPSCASPGCWSNGNETQALTQVGGAWSAGSWDFSEQCGTLDSFTCTNGAGRPAHVDLAIQQVTPPWSNTGANPVVSVAYVTCPDAVNAMVIESCQQTTGVKCAYAAGAATEGEASPSSAPAPQAP